jgi:hypothetical protein
MQSLVKHTSFSRVALPRLLVPHIRPFADLYKKAYNKAIDQELGFVNSDDEFLPER